MSGPAAAARISIASSFLDALTKLDATDIKRTAAFLAKLVREQEYSGLHAEIVRKAHDRSIRSFRVTNDLRAIAQVDGSRTLLLYVSEHDEAYRWARARCVGCDTARGEVEIVSASEATLPGPEGPPTPGWMCEVVDGRTLCHLLDSAGIEHGLTT